MPVVDASVVVDWVAPGVDRDGPAWCLLDSLVESDAQVVAPRLLHEEVANALLTGCRRGHWDGQAADVSFGLLRELPIELSDETGDLDRAWELSRRFDEHPVYDMLYVALAERRREQLVTADEALVRRVALLGFVVAL